MKAEEYIRSNYTRMYKDKPLIINEFNTHFEVKSNVDESPLILSKKINE
jgi:hypothetical protein|tara:strand:+ start:58 stop:204 length:147 start_codon:yes stop_codon:yes gene_type:complete